MKGVSQRVFGNSPFFSEIGLDIQAVIELHQAVIQLVARPNIALVFCKGWIQRRNIRVFVIAENLTFCVLALLVFASAKNANQAK